MNDSYKDERTAKALEEADQRISRALGVREESDLNRKQLRQQRAKLRPFQRKLQKLRQQQAQIQALIDATK